MLSSGLPPPPSKQIVLFETQLENGQLVSVPPVLIRRLKQHVVSLPDTGVDVILGTNGNVWISSELSLLVFFQWCS